MSTGRARAARAGDGRTPPPPTGVAVTRFGLRLVAGLVRRPHLIPTALRQLALMAPRRWWEGKPHLPVPPAEYLAFRQVTATGRTDRLPEIDDTLEWLEWCRSMQAVCRR